MKMTISTSDRRCIISRPLHSFCCCAYLLNTLISASTMPQPPDEHWNAVFGNSELHLLYFTKEWSNGGKRKECTHRLYYGQDLVLIYKS